MKIAIPHFKRILCTLALCLATSSCASWIPDYREYKDPRDTPEYQAFLRGHGSVDWSSMRDYRFRKGHPRPREGILDATGYDRTLIQDELQLAMLYINTPGIRFAITGHTDPGECGNDCLSLSERRAQLVYRLLLKAHFPKDKILCVRGHGARFPLTTDPAQSDINRRVAIDIFFADDLPSDPCGMN